MPRTKSKQAPKSRSRVRTDSDRQADLNYDQRYAKVTVRMDKALKATAEKIAQAQGITVTEYIRLLVVEAIADSVVGRS